MVITGQFSVFQSEQFPNNYRSNRLPNQCSAIPPAVLNAPVSFTAELQAIQPFAPIQTRFGSKRQAAFVYWHSRLHRLM
jgi:hypothetical protein